jgi:hypothetical protein
MAGVGVCMLWWVRHGNVFVETLQPDYEVTQMDLSGRTMLLQKANHKYVVTCAAHCADFVIGKAYRMRNVINGLEFSGPQGTVILPIVQEDVTFPAEGGRG